jgi:hypothetical protein
MLHPYKHDSKRKELWKRIPLMSICSCVPAVDTTTGRDSACSQNLWLCTHPTSIPHLATSSAALPCVAAAATASTT